MTHFPLFYDLKDANILICGGGELALQRIRKLAPFGPRITVVSPDLSQEILDTEGITCIRRPFCEADLDMNPALVVIAEPEEKTGPIYAECKRRHIPVNAVDQPKYCDIIFPSVIAREHLCVGISSGGLSPTATVVLRELFEDLLPENLDTILEWMPQAKAYVNQHFPKEARNPLLRQIFTEALTKQRPLTEEELQGDKGTVLLSPFS